MRVVLPVLAVVISLFSVTGCKTDDPQTDKVHSALRPVAAPLSDYLPHHELLARQADTFPFHYFYVDPNFGVYDHIRIAPVDTSYLRETGAWAAYDQKLSGTLGEDVAKVADFMRKAYVEAFEKADVGPRLSVTERTDLPKTLVLEPALIALIPSKAELNALGLAGSFFVPGLGIITSLASAGSVTIECRLRDAQTGRIVAMYATTEKDPVALIPVANFTWTSTARINIKTVAANTAKVLAAKDPRKIRRDFPIRFATRIKDGKLDSERK